MNKVHLNFLHNLSSSNSFKNKRTPTQKFSTQNFKNTDLIFLYMEYVGISYNEDNNTLNYSGRTYIPISTLSEWVTLSGNS
jgi:hypothetical protein